MHIMDLLALPPSLHPPPRIFVICHVGLAVISLLSMQISMYETNTDYSVLTSIDSWSSIVMSVQQFSPRYHDSVEFKFYLGTVHDMK